MCSVRLQPVRRRVAWGRPPRNSRALEARPPDLDAADGDLGVLLLADEVDLGGADIGVAGKLAHLVQSTVTMYLR